MRRIKVMQLMAFVGLFGLLSAPIIGVVEGNTAEATGYGHSYERRARRTRTKHFTVTIHNVSHDQVLAPGAYAVHDRSVSLNFNGMISPASFESLSEIGSNDAFVMFLENTPGVREVVRVDAPIMPGQSTSFDVWVPRGYKLSGLQMPVGTNDGLALVDSVRLNRKHRTVYANNYDNGTEENSPLLSGFDGGQPDPSRGAENIDNGVATMPQEAFRRHPQLMDPVLKLEIVRHQNTRW